MRNSTRASIALLMLLTSCGAFYNQPTKPQVANIGESTPATSSLKLLPAPKERVVVGLYKFRDQTGQYKASEVGSTFSTAVTQGATSILIKALEDSKWFIPIERENIGNLLQERNLIRSTRQEYSKNANPNDPQLTPLLYAGVLLEGGIISYDSNIITGGFGARYFGAGGSTKYRQDRVTIYLRMISTANGKIMKSVYVSKTVLSQAIDHSFFRYVKVKRLLEVETGYTVNEPVHMAVTEAIEKAVESLIIEGIKDNVWTANAPQNEIDSLVANYDAEKTIADASLILDRHMVERRSNIGIEIAGGASIIDGDLSQSLFRPMGKAALKLLFTPNFAVSASGNIMGLANKDRLDVNHLTFDLNAEYLMLPKDKFSPFVFAGAGAGSTVAIDEIYYKFQYGLGAEYMLSNSIGIKFFGEHNLPFSDNIDLIQRGSRDDFYFRFGTGLTFYLRSKNKKEQPQLSVPVESPQF